MLFELKIKIKESRIKIKSKYWRKESVCNELLQNLIGGLCNKSLTQKKLFGGSWPSHFIIYCTYICNHTVFTHSLFLVYSFVFTIYLLFIGSRATVHKSLR